MSIPGRVPERRHGLRSAGRTRGLPWLCSLQPRSLWAADAPHSPPLRAAFLHFPTGMYADHFVPQQTGDRYTLSPILQPLEPVRSDVLVLSGLEKAASRSGDGHYSKTANFLTGMPVRRTIGRDVSAGGISVDQLMATACKGKTPVPSLVLGVSPVMPGIDRSVGFTHAYASWISWQSESQPVTPEISPKIVYETLFGLTTDAAPGRSAAKPLLDYLLDDARRLRRRLGRDDGHKLDEYLDSVRAVEARLQFTPSDTSRLHSQSLQHDIRDLTLPPPGTQIDFREHIRLMFDLIVLAFRADATRVVSLMLAGGVSSQSFAFLDGVRGEHHELSHHENSPQKIAQYDAITRWYVAQFAQLLQRLRSLPEGSGTLLDSCMIMLGSGMSDGNSHNPSNLPILLGGRGGYTIDSGRHIAADAPHTPLCNLYLSLLDRMQIPLSSFGDSTGRLSLQNTPGG
ncbi:MAG: DUF1552 domain-containing protein [Planctomycetota bacterium]